MTKQNKRFLSALLALILLLTNFPVVSAASDSFAIHYEGKAVTEAEFYEHERITVSAEGNPGGSYQWQIQIPGTEQWVNIQGQTGQTINLSKAVVGSLMVGGSAYVRCAAISDGEEIDHTAALRTTVKKEASAPQTPAAPVVTAPAPTPAKPAPEPTEAPVEATEVPIEATEAPAEAPAEPTAPETPEDTTDPIAQTEPAAPEVPAEPAPEATEAPAETIEIPAEVVETPAETAAPAEEPAAEPAEAPVVTEAPVEATEAPVEATEAPAATEEPTEIPAEPTEEKPVETFVEKAAQLLAPKANADEGTDIEIVTVTIHYRAVDRNNKFEKTQEDASSKENAANAEPVTDPYVAHIVSGSDLNVTVPCRVIPGYTLEVPSYHDDAGIKVDGNNLTVSLKSVTKDTTFYVYYKESLVSYTARYFMQNVYNDLYTEDTAILTDEIKAKMKGYPGGTPDPTIIYPTVTGFTALFFQPDTIAADGSTVFEVYYDRNYYLMNFNMDGGYGTAPVYARYGTAFTVANPTKAGWAFDGWELEKVEGKDATEEDKKTRPYPSTIPAENRTYKAIWKQGDTTYTVAYWLEDPNTHGKYNYHSSEIIDATSGDLVTAQEYLTDEKKSDLFDLDAPYIQCDEDKTTAEQNKQEHLNSEGKVIVQGDGSTILNVYFAPKEYKLRFYYAAQINSKYYVIGGSVNYFTDYQSNDEKESLHYNFVRNSTQRNEIKSIPALNEKGQARKNDGDYTLSYIDYQGNTYYYLQFTARYGGDIEELWPIDVFNSIEAENPAYPNYPAYQGGWGGENNVYYSRYNASRTIKGIYRKLVKELLFESEANCTDGIVSYLGWYVNASNAPWSHPVQWIYEIYTPLLTGESSTDILKQDGVTYKLIDRYSVYDSTRSDDNQDWEVRRNMAQIEMDGYETARESIFTRETDSGTCEQVYRIKYFYKNREYTVSYYNYNQALAPKTLSYFESINAYETPEYPTDSLEPDAYYFDGWYTSSEFQPATKFYDANGNYVGQELTCNSNRVPLMPSSDIALYAHWLPIEYDTYFYLDYERYMQREKADGTIDESVLYRKVTGTKHGTAMNNPPDIPTHDKNDTYKFVGWFYIDTDGTKKAFNPSEMAVRKELHLFAEWTTTTVKEYTVSYQYGQKLSNGEYGPATTPPFDMAEDSKGYALEATTKTFAALPKEKLTNFPDGTENQLWLPHTNSHSIVMRPENSENVFTFYYITATKAPYTVRYLDATTHEPILYKDGAEVIGGDPDNKNAVVTETFVYVEGYIPDAFHKRLVLSANEEENVIIFYYTKDDIDDGDEGGGDEQKQHSRYLVTHYIQDLGANTYSTYDSNDLIGVVGDTVTAEPLDIKGFTFDSVKTKNVTKQTTEQDTTTGKWTVSGKVTTGEGTDEENEPLKLELYYERKSYDYKIEYRDWDNKELLPNAVNEAKNALFEAVVSETATEIQGYDLYGAQTQSLKISWDEKLNVITFYYIKKKVTIEYIPICTDAGLTGFGGVSNPVELDKTQATLSGSQASAASGFLFKGWYTDWNSANPTLITGEAQLKAEKITITSDVYDYTYYAVFEPITLTISQTNMNPTDSAVYEVVRGVDVIARVMLTGTDSVILQAIPEGTYTVREAIGNWTWTYEEHSPATQTVKVEAGRENKVSFDYDGKYEAPCWLHSETHG